MTTYKAWTPPPGAVVDPPVANWRKVLGMYSDGSRDDEPKPAGDINWSSYGDGPRVVAYSVVEEYKPAPGLREWWMVAGRTYVREVDARSYALTLHPSVNDVIHVREVPAPSREVVAWAAVSPDGDVLACHNEAYAHSAAYDRGWSVVKLTGVRP